MTICVAIVGFRNAGDIQRCVTALGASTWSDFEVVICENGGPDAFAALGAVVPASLPGGQAVRIILAPGNLGFAGGVNVCLRQSPTAEAWWVLNPDTEPRPDAMTALVERLRRGDCEAVGSILVRPNGEVQSYGGRWRPWLARAEAIGMGARLGDPVDARAVEAAQSYITGASILIGRTFLETVGPMREDYFLYAEEVEWCLRGLRRGMRLGFAPGSVVLHAQGATTGSAATMRERPRMPIYLDERNKMLVTRDCFPARLPVAAAAALALVLLRFGRARAWRQLRYGLAGWLAGLAGRRGPPAWLSAG